MRVLDECADYSFMSEKGRYTVKMPAIVGVIEGGIVAQDFVGSLVIKMTFKLVGRSGVIRH